MAGELGDISGFLAEAGGVSNLDWLDVDEEEYRQQDTLPKQNLDIIPDLEAAWSHRPELATNFVPNTGEPTTMLDIVQAPPGGARGHRPHGPSPAHAIHER
jgi:hypothetical protein